MKKANLIVILFLVFISCSKSDDTNQSFEINGRYEHQISGCDNKKNPEINCVDFINFIDDSTVDVLIGGGDIIYRTKYHLDKNKVEIEQIGGLNFDISFKIKNSSILNRIEDNQVWLKAK